MGVRTSLIHHRSNFGSILTFEGKVLHSFMLGEEKGLGPKIPWSKNYCKNPSETVSHSGGCKTDHLKIYSLRFASSKH